MSTVVQTTYRPQIAPFLVGQVPDETSNSIATRLCETVAGIGFGLAVSQGVKDKGVVLGGSNFVGVSVRDVTLDRLPIDPLSSTETAVDMYPQYSNMGVISRGHIAVLAGASVKPGDPLFYDTTTGTFSNSASGESAIGNIVFTVNPAPSQTITVNGTVITFVASGATGSQVNIGPTLGDTILALANFINANVAVDANIAEVTASAYPPSPGGAGEGSGANTLMLAAAAVGVGAAGPPKTGNDATLATNVPGATLSGATLGGGTAAATAVDGGFWVTSAIAGEVAKISLALQR